MEVVLFQQAKPIFLKDLENEMNILAAFTCQLSACQKPVTLRITGATYYRVSLNEHTILYGPARTAAGYASVDTLTLDVSKGGNLLIEVAGYNCRTLSNAFHSSFLIAELLVDNTVIAATGTNAFQSFRDMSRVQKTMRFSYQRHFSEVYHGYKNYVPWEWEIVDNSLTFFDREVPLPYMETISVKQILAKGVYCETERDIPRVRFINPVPNKRTDGFPLNELSEIPHHEYYCLSFDGHYVCSDSLFEDVIHQGQYIMYDFKQMQTGFITTEVEVLEDCRFFLSLEEYSPKPYVTSERLFAQHCQTISYTLPKGRYQLESFEVYSLRHLQYTVLEGSLIIHRAGIRTYMFPPILKAVQTFENNSLDAIYQAAIESFRQNTVDIYMDCSMRERAGWLCDSFFSGRVERALTGDNVVERAFLRNFSRSAHWKELPEGVLPMCYPSDVIDDYIPQWIMWYVLQLKEALDFTDKLEREEFRSVCYGFTEWAKGYLNEYGLLENLPSWNFIEWSKCNDWTEGVNYPTNFLYSAALHAIGTIYDDPALVAESENVRNHTIKYSFDGTFFAENAIRNESNTLKNTGNISEACQYYAVYLGKVDLSEPCYEPLLHAITDIFGKDHSEYAKLGRDIEPASMFIGNYMRLLTLLEYQKYDTIIDNVERFYGHMAEYTGTLWEHKQIEYGSLNHGFASFAGIALELAFINRK